jgi:cell wall-associated NlpC family hydrolase
LKPFKNYATSVALGVLTLASFSALAQSDKSVNTPKSNKPSSSSSKSVSEWDKYRSTANRASIADALAHKALSFRGARYRMGGTTSSGFDCSGLTQAVYKKWGMQLPRTSTEQFGKGKPVAKGQLKPGDLVFFSNTYKHGISHVGIYVGDMKFVHAAGYGKGVVVSSLKEDYHANHYAGARRIVLEKPAPVEESETSQ